MDRSRHICFPTLGHVPCAVCVVLNRSSRVGIGNRLVLALPLPSVVHTCMFSGCFPERLEWTLATPGVAFFRTDC